MKNTQNSHFKYLYIYCIKSKNNIVTINNIDIDNNNNKIIICQEPIEYVASTYVYTCFESILTIFLQIIGINKFCRVLCMFIVICWLIFFHINCESTINKCLKKINKINVPRDGG